MDKKRKDEPDVSVERHSGVEQSSLPQYGYSKAEIIKPAEEKVKIHPNGQWSLEKSVASPTISLDPKHLSVEGSKVNYKGTHIGNAAEVSEGQHSFTPKPGMEHHFQGPKGPSSLRQTSARHRQNYNHVISAIRKS